MITPPPRQLIVEQQHSIPRSLGMEQHSYPIGEQISLCTSLHEDLFGPQSGRGGVLSQKEFHPCLIVGQQQCSIMRTLGMECHLVFHHCYLVIRLPSPLSWPLVGGTQERGEGGLNAKHGEACFAYNKVQPLAAQRRWRELLCSFSMAKLTIWLLESVTNWLNSVILHHSPKNLWY